MILVSHDIAMVQGFCDMVVSLSPNKPEVSKTEASLIMH